MATIVIRPSKHREVFPRQKRGRLKPERNPLFPQVPGTRDKMALPGLAFPAREHEVKFPRPKGKPRKKRATKKR